jgi:fimbrial isopeptide formation D2 family protein/LPXTG-motif cell wall-anchored protein
MQTGKRKTSIITTLLLAACLIVMAVPFVSHADSSLPPAHGNLYIHKYKMADLADAKDTSDGTELNDSDSSEVPTSAALLDGVGFKIYKVIIADSGDLKGVYPASQGAITLNPTSNPSKITDSLGHEYDVTYVETVTTGAIEQYNKGVAKAGNLDQGVYLVVEQENSEVAAPAAPFVVSVPMTNPDGDGWLEDVHVYPKNEDLSIEKKVSTPTVNIGDVVTFTITPTVPSDIATAEKYDIVDTLDAALDYKENSVVLKGAETKSGLATASITAFTKGDDYKVTYSEGRELRISFTKAGREKLEGVKFLEISFDATVNAGILERSEHTVENDAMIDFTNSFGEDKTRTSTKTQTHTGRIVVDKRDAADNQVKLAGAKFKIAATLDDANNEEHFLRISGGAILKYGDTDYDDVSDYEVETDNDGVAAFEGLLDYTESDSTKTYKTYYLVETQAPEGYNLLTEPVEVTFDGTADADNSYTVTALIKNNAGFTLPKTGGMGTFIFTLGGIALMGAALLIYVTRRRKDRRAEK